MVLISTSSEFFFKDNFKHYNPESLTWIFTFSDTQSLNMELLKGRTGNIFPPDDAFIFPLTCFGPAFVYYVMYALLIYTATSRMQNFIKTL